MNRIRMRVTSGFALLCVMALFACGARTELDDGTGGNGAGGLGSTSGSVVTAGTTTGTGLIQCACPDKAGYLPCASPLNCCACNDDGLGWTVDRCRNPATFNCSCGHTLMCP